jgi:hypothetical protein
LEISLAHLALAAILLYGPAILKTDVSEDPGAPGLRQAELSHAHGRGSVAHPLVMLRRENGSGKSTLLHSIYYALRG